MAATLFNEFGETVNIRWSSGQVKQQINAETEANAFALTTETGLQVDDLPDGRRVISYLVGETVTRKYATDGKTYA